MTSFGKLDSFDEAQPNIVFPVSAEHLDGINSALLGETIFADPQTKISRAAQYERIIQSRMQTFAGKTAFEVAVDESPFSEYS